MTAIGSYSSANGGGLTTAEARAARQSAADQLNSAVANGSSKAQKEALIASLGPPVYSEEELKADEDEINGREALRQKLRAGISDPVEEFKAKAFLVMPWSWSEEDKLKGALSAQEHGVLDSHVDSWLSAQRGYTKREMEATYAAHAAWRREGRTVEGWAPRSDIWKPVPGQPGVYMFALSEEEAIARGIITKGPIPVPTEAAEQPESLSVTPETEEVDAPRREASTSSGDVSAMVRAYLTILKEQEEEAERRQMASPDTSDDALQSSSEPAQWPSLGEASPQAGLDIQQDGTYFPERFI